MEGSHTEGAQGPGDDFPDDPLYLEVAVVCKKRLEGAGKGEDPGDLLERSLKAAKLVVERVEGSNTEMFLKIGAGVKVVGLAAESLQLRKATILGLAAVFKWEDQHMFVRQPNGQLFNWTERYQCLHNIIYHAAIDSEKTVKVQLAGEPEGELDIEPEVPLVPLLEKKGFIKECFPLHVEPLRKKLLHDWCFNWLSLSQPLDDICAYFGVKVAIYFAFLGMYTTWLWFLACIGLFAYFKNWGSFHVAVPPAFGVVVVLWAVFFLQFWKRRNVELMERWEITGDEDEINVQDKAWSPSQVKEIQNFDSLLTNVGEIQSSWELQEEEWTGRILSLWSNAVALLAVVVVQLPLEALYHYSLHATSHYTFLQYVLTVIYVAVVGQLTTAGGELGMWLNGRVRYVSGEAAADALVTKVFAIYFVQSFFGLIYTAVVHRDFTSLRQFLFRRLVVSQVLNNITESLLPYLKYRYNRYNALKAERDAKKEDGNIAEVARRPSDVERQYLMLPYVASVGGGSYDGVFDDFLELALQFGMVTMFACCFPLVGVFSLLNNLIEVHSDSFKLLTTLRRPVPHKVASIGSWLTIFQYIGVVAIVSNCVLVVYMYDKGKWYIHPGLLMMLLLEHMLLLARHGIAWFIPEEPAWVKMKRRKREKVRDHFSAEVLRAFGSKKKTSA